MNDHPQKRLFLIYEYRHNGQIIYRHTPGVKTLTDQVDM